MWDKIEKIALQKVTARKSSMSLGEFNEVMRAVFEAITESGLYLEKIPVPPMGMKQTPAGALDKRG